jgi:uncharacterized protein YtpQ (UPF0354 family)
MRKTFKFSLLLALPAMVLLVLAGCGKSDPVNGHLFNEMGWQKLLKDPTLSKDEFTRLYALAAAARFGGCKVYITGDREVTMELYDGGEFKASLKDLWDKTVKDPANRPAACYRHLADLAVSKAATGAMAIRVSTNTILPVICNDPFVQGIRMTQPKDGNQLVVEPFVADIYVLYFGNRDGTGVYITEGDLSLLHLNLPVLHKLAAANLDDLVPIVKHEDPNPLFTVAAVGRYGTSLLFADTFWDKQATVVRGELIAAVPSPDALLFTGSASPDGVRQLRAKVQEIYSGNREAISKALLVRRNGKWEEFKD